MQERNLLIVVFLCFCSFVRGEERFALHGIADSTFVNRNLSFSPYDAPDSRTDWNGGFTLLGSFRLKEGLTAYYEGRVNHSEGLSGTSPRLQHTRTDPVLQAYLRYSPRLAWDLNFQLGKFGTPFGQFLTRNYSNENPLIGYPLIYTHRTPVSASYVPTDVGELLSYRGRGQGPGFYAFSQGNVWLPLGVSYAEGPYLDGSANRWLAPGQSIDDFKQKALGFDLQYTLHHLEVYAELVFNRFDVPNVLQSLG